MRQHGNRNRKLVNFWLLCQKRIVKRKIGIKKRNEEKEKSKKKKKKRRSIREKILVKDHFWSINFPLQLLCFVMTDKQKMKKKKKKKKKKVSEDG